MANPTKGKRPRPEMEYTVRELAESGIFEPGISPDCITAALRSAGCTKAAKGRALQIVNEFMKREVR